MVLADSGSRPYEVSNDVMKVRISEVSNDDIFGTCRPINFVFDSSCLLSTSFTGLLVSCLVFNCFQVGTANAARLPPYTLHIPMCSASHVPLHVTGSSQQQSAASRGWPFAPCHAAAAAAAAALGHHHHHHHSTHPLLKKHTLDKHQIGKSSLASCSRAHPSSTELLY